MISIRKYLYGQQPAASENPVEAEEFCVALAELGSTLLQAVESEVFCDPHPRLRVYQDTLRQLREKMNSDAEPGMVDKSGTEAVRLIGEYRRTRDELEGAQTAEVQNIIAMLHQTVQVLSSGSERSVSRLKKVEDDLKHASMLGDIVALKSQLSDTMRYVQEQNSREREDSARTVSEIARGVQRVQEGLALARSGMPGRAEAEERLHQAIEARGTYAAAVLVLDRLPVIKQRFGGAVSERYVHLFVQDLMRAIPLEKKLFRWAEAALVLELTTSSPLDRLRGEMHAMLANIPQERQLDVGQRMAVFGNSHRWTVIPLADVQTSAEAIRRIEQFGK
jgi:hypothetical protein